MDTIVVTRHPALVQVLAELGLAPEGTPVFSQVTAEDVRGHHVVGVLPLHLAELAARVTVLPLTVPAELRGTELSVEQVRELMGTPVTYEVHRYQECLICGGSRGWGMCCAQCGYS